VVLGGGAEMGGGGKMIFEPYDPDKYVPSLEYIAKHIYQPVLWFWEDAEMGGNGCMISTGAAPLSITTAYSARPRERCC
jgi:hypothetical protein